MFNNYVKVILLLVLLVGCRQDLDKSFSTIHVYFAGGFGQIISIAAVSEEHVLEYGYYYEVNDSIQIADMKKCMDDFEISKSYASTSTNYALAFFLDQNQDTVMEINFIGNKSSVIIDEIPFDVTQNFIDKMNATFPCDSLTKEEKFSSSICDY